MIIDPDSEILNGKLRTETHIGSDSSDDSKCMHNTKSDVFLYLYALIISI
jgi:hypothetical protein